MTFFCVHLILGSKLDVERREDLFFGLHLSLWGKLDVERRENLFFWSAPIFSVKTETGNCGPSLFKFLGKPLRSASSYWTAGEQS